MCKSTTKPNHRIRVKKDVCAQSLQLCLTLYDPMDPARILCLWASPDKILEWVAMSSPRRSSWSRDLTYISCGSCTAGRFFTTDLPGKPQKDVTWRKKYSLRTMLRLIILFHWRLVYYVFHFVSLKISLLCIFLLSRTSFTFFLFTASFWLVIWTNI